MARVLTNEELQAIDYLMQEENIPEDEREAHFRDLENFIPKKVELKGINPENISHIQAQRKSSAGESLFR